MLSRGYLHCVNREKYHHHDFCCRICKLMIECPKWLAKNACLNHKEALTR